LKEQSVPEDTPLLFAVLDGQSPRDWPLFGTKFSNLMQEAKQKAKPKGVRPVVRNAFDIYIEPMIKSPEELLEVDKLDALAGVIMDALPQPGGTNDLDAKLEKYHAHILKATNLTKDSNRAMFRKIGYEIWFVSEDDPDKLSKCVEDARISAAMLTPSSISHVFLPSKDAFIDHMATYLSNVYLKMYRGL
jgi:hypothetical protein